MPELAIVGTEVPRIEGREKVTGSSLYATDVVFPGMLWGKVLRSTLPHARLKHLDVAEARRVPGVHAVLTGADVAGILVGTSLKDRPVLCEERALFIGDPIAAVAADSSDAAEQAVRLIDVEYEPLPAVFDAQQALTDAAPLLHPNASSYVGQIERPDIPNLQSVVHVKKGDVEQGFAEADVVFEHTFRLPSTHQGYIEPRGCAVKIEDDGTVRVWSSSQAPYRLRDLMAEMLDLPKNKVIVERTTVGGSFGAKGGMYLESVAYYLARASGRPVKMVPSYTEELMAGTPRHPATITLKTGVNRDGTLVARKALVVMDGGAYAAPKAQPSLILPSVTRGLGPYRIPNTEIEALWAYTNNTPGGIARAPGQPQVVFAGESQIDVIAEALGLDPLDFRLRNVATEGDVWPDNSHYEGVMTRQTLELLRKTAGWDEPTAPHHGRGMAMTERSVGAGPTGLLVTLNDNGTLTAMSAVPDVGTGAFTILKQMLAEEMHLPLEAVTITTGNTNEAPTDSGIGGSRHTYSLTVAVVETTTALKARLSEVAAERLECAVEDVELVRNGYQVRGHPGSQVPTRDIIADAVAQSDEPVQARSAGPGRGQKAPQSCIVAYAAEVEVDPVSGRVTPVKLVGVHDVGRAVNPQLLRAQIEGATIQGLGMALMEDLGREDGKVAVANLDEYKLPCLADVPELILAFVEDAPGPGPYAAKSAAELSNVPVSAAVANAVARACGARVFQLPITAERVWDALHKRATVVAGS